MELRGEVFSVGDGIYLDPGTLENVQKWNTAVKMRGQGLQIVDENVDKTIMTEYYRYNSAISVSLQNLLKQETI